jgi:hypothetical protein
VPGVNNLGKYGRWAFAEFTEVFEIEAAGREHTQWFAVVSLHAAKSWSPMCRWPASRRCGGSGAHRLRERVNGRRGCRRDAAA